MNLQCTLSHNEGTVWRKLECTVGELYYKGNDWEIYAPLQRWAAGDDADISALRELLKRLPYHYAVVYQGSDELFAAVDQVRTHPLFYGEIDGALFCTDDPYKLSGVSLRTDNSIALAEFQLSGYSGRGDTLDRSVKSLPARHFLWAAVEKTDNSVVVGEYRSRISGEADLSSSEETVGQRLQDVGDEIFAELCNGVKSRQIVLPLSSGYDSRYIAAMLKRHGHRDVVTYTYGEKGSWELDVSRETAKKLGFAWHYVPYDRSFWRKQYQSHEMQSYLPFASRHTSTPHIQDWPAVRALKDAKLIAEDAIFVPGHTCVLVSNRLEREVVQRPLTNWVQLLSGSLYRHHFILQRPGRVTRDVQSILRRIKKALPDDIGDDPHSLLNAYFNFEAEERHGKMLINSARVYEFWGHEWAMPLWDGRLIAAWAKVPYEGRYSKRAFRNFLYKENFFGLFPAPERPGMYNRAREKVKATPGLFKPLKRLKCAENRLFGYFHEHFDWFGIVSYPRYVYHMGRCGDVYSLLSRLYLQYLEAKPPLP